MKKLRRSSVYVRNVIFGVEDSLVSTVGLLSGIAAVGVPHRIILMTGIILIFVEGVSMAIGSFLSEESAQEYENGKGADGAEAILGGAVMFVSYVAAGMIPVLPYLFLAGDIALAWSIGLSVATLAALGFAHAVLSRLSPVPRALRMMLLGGFAILVGVVVGKVVGIV